MLLGYTYFFDTAVLYNNYFSKGSLTHKHDETTITHNHHTGHHHTSHREITHTHIRTHITCTSHIDTSIHVRSVPTLIGVPLRAHTGRRQEGDKLLARAVRLPGHERGRGGSTGQTGVELWSEWCGVAWRDGTGHNVTLRYITLRHIALYDRTLHNAM